eukprot:2687910-Prorocentrum_lima.AAC.1
MHTPPRGTQGVPCDYSSALFIDFTTVPPAKNSPRETASASLEAAEEVPRRLGRGTIHHKRSIF